MAVGYALVAVDGVVGTSGTPKILYSINWVSDGTAGVIKIYDGTSTAGTLVYQETGVINQGVYRLFGGTEGIVLKNGMYLDIDAHDVNVIIGYKEIL